MFLRTTVVVRDVPCRSTADEWRVPAKPDVYGSIGERLEVSRQRSCLRCPQGDRLRISWGFASAPIHSRKVYNHVTSEEIIIGRDFTSVSTTSNQARQLGKAIDTRQRNSRVRPVHRYSPIESPRVAVCVPLRKISAKLNELYTRVIQPLTGIQIDLG